MHSFIPALVQEKGNQIYLSYELLQAMYASVYDAALAVGIAVHNVMNRGLDGKETVDSNFTDRKCPLRSASARQGALGWKLLHELKKVKIALGGDTLGWCLQCVPSRNALYGLSFLSYLLASKSLNGFHFNLLLLKYLSRVISPILIGLFSSNHISR